MKRIIFVTTLLCLNSSTSLAGDIPAVIASHEITPLSAATVKTTDIIVPDIKRTATEEWEHTGIAKSVREKDGQLLFPYGESQPSITCSVNHVCDIELQTGETIKNVAAGDTARWYIQPAESGSTGDITPHVIIKPTQNGLETNLILTTDKRTYYLTLRSSDKEYVTRIGFYYPRELVQTWAKEAKTQTDKRISTVADVTSIDKLDFNYSIGGTAPFRPERVFNDGTHVFIQMAKDLNSGQAPALMLLDPNDNTQLVNYRVNGNYYVIDRLFEKALLVTGVGVNAQKVTITKKSSASCSFFDCFTR